MSGSKRYLLDANVFIEAKNRYYPPGLCPGFWDALIDRHEKGRVFSIDKIRDELTKTNNEQNAEPDWLSEWVKSEIPKTFFEQIQDATVVDAYQDIIKWVDGRGQFFPNAKEEFASAADGWLVAHAKANGLVVVTHEEGSPDVKKRVPIPNVCLKFKVDYVNTFEMLEDLKVKFVLST